MQISVATYVSDRSNFCAKCTKPPPCDIGSGLFARFPSILAFIVADPTSSGSLLAILAIPQTILGLSALFGCMR